jgi:DNA-binding transcriptional MocR family regulator
MAATVPRYQRLADDLWEAILQSGLANGSRLPSVRILAAQHGVSVTTALHALRRLEDLGRIAARPRSGYYLVTPTPQSSATSHAGRREWPDPLPPLDAQAQDHLAMVGAPCAVQLDLASGAPALYPVDRFNILLRRHAYQDTDLVGAYARGNGHPALQREIARQAIHYSCHLDPDEVVVTNGCIEALNLALRAVTRPGDIVAVESPTYFTLLQILRALELTVLPVPCRADTGMDLTALRDALDHAPVKAVVTIANANNPIGSVAPDDAKRALVDLLQARGIPLIEDDIFGDVCFDDRRPRPVRSFDSAGNVLLCGGFSKSLCPGLRLGWIAAGRFADRVKALKYTTSMATAALQQAVVADMLASGGYALHLRRLKAALLQQHGHLRDAVLRYFPVGTQVSRPGGGFVQWVTLPPTEYGLPSTRPLFETARAASIGFAPGHLFGLNGGYDNCLRLNAGNQWTPAVESAIARLGEWLTQSPTCAQGV